jgi:cytochrome P450
VAARLPEDAGRATARRAEPREEAHEGTGLSLPALDEPLRSELIVADPYPFYARLRRDAPVWQVPGTEVFFVSTWALVDEATSRVADFSNHFRHTLYVDDDGALAVVVAGEDGPPDVFAGADPPVHTEHRKLFFPELMQRKMAALEGEVTAIADELLDVMLREEGGDVAQLLANPLPMRVITELVIGFDGADVDATQRWVFAGSRFMGARLTLADMAAVAEEAMDLAPWVGARLDAALADGVRGDGSVIGVAAAGVRDGVLSRDGAAFALMVLLGAGGETTTSLIGNAVRILAERTELQEELRDAPGRIAAFVEEVLRFESPFRFHPRTATRSTNLGGVTIPERAMVALLWGSANRDEAVFAAPDEVRLDRPSTRLHLGFGRGIHHCVGAALARLEARVVLTELLARTTRFVLDPDGEPRWTDSLWIRRHEQLPLVWECRR